MGTIKGDFYFQDAKIKGSATLRGILVDGLVNFQRTIIEGALDLTDANIKEFLILKQTVVQSETKLENLKCKEKII